MDADEMMAVITARMGMKMENELLWGRGAPFNPNPAELMREYQQKRNLFDFLKDNPDVKRAVESGVWGLNIRALMEDRGWETRTYDISEPMKATLLGA